MSYKKVCYGYLSLIQAAQKVAIFFAHSLSFQFATECHFLEAYDLLPSNSILALTFFNAFLASGAAQRGNARKRLKPTEYTYSYAEILSLVQCFHHLPHYYPRQVFHFISLFQTIQPHGLLIAIISSRRMCKWHLSRTSSHSLISVLV